MRTLSYLLVSAWTVGCGFSDDEPAAFTPPPYRLDAGLARRPLDAGASATASRDAGMACAALSVCSEGKPSLLYNVCITGAGSTSASHACLVDSNGSLYLATLASGQTVVNRGWTQSGASAGSTLSPQDEQRCAAALAALSADAAAPCMQQ